MRQRGQIFNEDKKQKSDLRSLFLDMANVLNNVQQLMLVNVIHNHSLVFSESYIIKS